MNTVVDFPPSINGRPAASAADARARSLSGAGDAVAAAPAQLPLALAIFVSAFLLFQVQLLLGKEILPLFGGSAAVWSVCVFVFQLLFLAGYAYSHLLASRLPLRRQVTLHGALLCLCALVVAAPAVMKSVPIGMAAGWHPRPGASPTWTIIELLFTAIGLPFFLLSATSPLLQHWLAQSGEGRVPYRLYALSNLGSLLGLLSYPFLVEPHLRLAAQRWGWAAGFGVFLLSYFLSAAAVLRSSAGGAGSAGARPSTAAAGAPAAADSEAGWQRRLLWASLAACASVLLLATTNLICQNITASPFLWVLELGLYLLSFILCFESDRWYRRAIFFPAFAVTLALVIVVTLPDAAFSFAAQLAAFSAALFAGCMVCHGEAARTRPRPESLTAFYLSLAAGGAAGGIAVSLIAPRIFVDYWEYPLGMLGCLAVLYEFSVRDRASWWHRGRLWLALLILAGAALLAPAVLAPLWPAAARALAPLHLYAAAAAAAGIACALPWRKRADGADAPSSLSPALVRAAARIALAIFVAGLLIPQKAALYHVVASSRNFYGVLSVVGVGAVAADGDYLALRYGGTLHGFQYLDPARARQATGYYGPGSGANIVIRNWPAHPMRVGLVGMGVGTLAALARPGDLYRFYEINPDVYKLSSGSQPSFTYLRDSPGQVQVVMGDARQSLEQEARQGDFQKFDVLVLDAFSGDAIPMHLLTREAFALYAEHLRGPGSVIAVHISNQTIDLRPVLAGVARDFGFAAVRVDPLLPNGPFSQSDWVLLSRDRAALGGAELAAHADAFPGTIAPLSWTDDYCDLFRVIRWRE